MKNINKILSIILVILMMISIIPITASASATGAFGDNITWVYDLSTCTLTISGTGVMGDCYDPNRPWQSYINQIKTIIISNGVTSIGAGVFQSCNNVVNVIIPSSVNEIGQYAFHDCKSLTSIIIPDGVTTIGSNAFSGCNKLTDITISDSVTDVEKSAVSGTSYYNNEENWENNVLYINNHLICAKEEISGTYTVKNGTKTISEDAFYNCKSLAGIVIPDGVTTIGCNAFSGCNKLTNITIPDSVTTIGQSAFSGTGQYNNGKNWENNVLYINNHLICAKEKISGTYTVKNGTKTISEAAFSICKSLKSVIIPDSVTTVGESAFSNCWGLGSVSFGNGVTSICDYAFFNCDGLANIVFPESLEYIGVRAFDECGGFAEISIPASVKSIGSDAFNYCESLAFITVDSNNKNYSNDEHGVLFNKDKTLLIEYPKNNRKAEYTIPDSVIEIGMHSFYPCENLVSVTFGTGVKIIGEGAFACCNGLVEVIIPEGITKISSQAFYRCNSLANVVIGNGIELIGSEAFCDSDLYSITIPDSIKTIGVSAFNNCEKLSEVYYGGPENKWNAISIGTYNDALLNATINFTKCKHNYTCNVTKPTCTEKGYTTYTCECGDTYIDNYVDALGHAPANAIEEYYFLPNCTEIGSKDVVVYCSVCKEELSRETVVLNETGHADNDGDGYCDMCDENFDSTIESGYHNLEIEKLIRIIILIFQMLLGFN